MSTCFASCTVVVVVVVFLYRWWWFFVVFCMWCVMCVWACVVWLLAAPPSPFFPIWKGLRTTTAQIVFGYRCSPSVCGLWGVPSIGLFIAVIPLMILQFNNSQILFLYTLNYRGWSFSTKQYTGIRFQANALSLHAHISCSRCWSTGTSRPGIYTHNGNSNILNCEHIVICNYAMHMPKWNLPKWKGYPWTMGLTI